jgi:RNA polymerase sigma factor (sigma-70 family)
MAVRRNPDPGVFGDPCGSGEIPQAISPGTDPEQAMLEKEKCEKLRQALHELPGQMRRCVQLRVEDCPTQDIAAVLRISINTVKAHLHQAKRILREKLAPYFSDEVARVDLEDNDG